MTRTAEQIVNAEVHYRVSYLVSTLAAGYGDSFGSSDLGDMAEQAMDLCSPIDDWEEAAIGAGFKHHRFFWYDANKYPSGSGGSAAYAADDFYEGDAQHICAAHDIEPYAREIFEHWIVSDWLADRLAEKGEKVGKDFAGMTVWASPSDSVIEAIVADLNKEA